ncbi:MAG: hypothetical protein R3E97_02355 [Candidatus Eisenbacteria bacterium]
MTQEGDSYSYEFACGTASGEEIPPGLSYRWQVERLLPATRALEIAPSTGTEATFTTSEPGDLEPDALLLVTVWTVVGVVTSEPISIVFGRGQIGPRARIVSPASPGGRDEIALPSTLAWDAYDAGDVLSQSPAVPEGFLCKLVDLADPTASEEDVLTAIAEGENLLAAGGETADWRLYDVTEREAVCRVPRVGFALAVRAVGEDEAEETALEIGRNVFVGSVAWEAPNGTQFDSGYERFAFPLHPPEELLSVGLPVGMPFRLEWNRPIYARYLLGSGDEEVPLVDWAWRTELDAPVVLSEEGAHRMTLEVASAVDDDVVVPLRIALRSVPLTPEGGIIIDDALLPADPLTDQYENEILGAALGRLGEVARDDVPESGDGPLYEVTMETLARYEIVLWHYSIAPGLDRRIRRSDAALRRYLRSGGRVFFVGGNLAALLSGTLRYPKDAPDDILPEWSEHRLWEELGMRDAITGIRTGASPAEVEASGLVGARPAISSLPELAIDPTKWDPWEILDEFSFRGGIARWEGLWNPDGLESPVEPLYSAATFDTTYSFGPRRSGRDDAVIAWRGVVAPEDGTTFHEGRIAVFDFEPYYFQDEAVETATSAAIEWLLN